MPLKNSKKNQSTTTAKLNSTQKENIQPSTQQKPVGKSQKLELHKIKNNFSQELAKQTGFSERKIVDVYLNNFLKSLKDHQTSPSKETLEKVCAGSFFISSKLSLYKDEEKFTFFNELILAKLLERNIIDAEKYATEMIQICDRLLTENRENTIQIKKKQLQAILSIFKIYRINKAFVVGNAETDQKIEHLILKAEAIFKECPELNLQKATFSIGLVLIKLIKYEPHSQTEANFNKLKELDWHLKSAFIYDQPDCSLPESIFEKKDIYLDIQYLGSAIKQYINQLLPYTASPSLLAETNLAACEIIQNNIEFLIKVTDFCRNCPVMTIPIDEGTINKIHSTKICISNRIEKLIKVINLQEVPSQTFLAIETSPEQSSTVSTATNKVDSKNEEEHIESQADNPKANTEKPLELPVSNEDLIKQAQAHLITGEFDTAEEILNSLLAKQNISLSSYIRTLIYIADLCNTKARANTEKLNLARCFHEKKAPTEEDISNIEIANRYFTDGFQHSKKAYELIKQCSEAPQFKDEIDQLLSSEEISFNSLKTAQAELKKKQDDYLEKMSTLKENLIRSDRWGPTSNSKSDTAIMLKKMEQHKNNTHELAEKLSEYATNFSQKNNGKTELNIVGYQTETQKTPKAQSSRPVTTFFTMPIVYIPIIPLPLAQVGHFITVPTDAPINKL